MNRTIVIVLFLVVAAGIGWGVRQRLLELEAGKVVAATERTPVPVAIGRVERGTLRLKRTFSGALESSAEFVAAPKVAGRLQSLEVDLGDSVERGQIVARLDDEEFVQSVREAEAALAVAEAGHAEAKSSLEIALRGFKRVESLREEGVSSESQLDSARAVELERRSRVDVTSAMVTRAAASLESARIRLGYAKIQANWSGGDDHRVVADRYVDEGGTVSANGQLLSIVELDPITAVVNVPERDYVLLSVGQKALLATDAYPGVQFVGSVARIAPVFRRSTRQARVELVVENSDERLKPGMFVRATIDVRSVEDAIIIPFDALSERGDQVGVFTLEANGERVEWRPVVVGVREGDRVEVQAVDLLGYVVTLGQELCEDGAPVTVRSSGEPPPLEPVERSGVVDGQGTAPAAQ